MLDTLSREIIAVVVFVVQHAALLAVILLVAAAAGTALWGARPPLALRAALGLAAMGQCFVVLGTLGLLRGGAIVTVALAAVVGGVARVGRTRPRAGSVAALIAAAAALLILAIYPPFAFDETLYHLPFIRAIAESGAIRFQPHIRFPIFPELHEALSVPAFLFAGDTATHVVALAQLLILASLVSCWPRRPDAGRLAAALVIGSPIAIQLGTTTYVEMAMALFVTAGFFSLDAARREGHTGDADTRVHEGALRPGWIAAAALCFGSACSVKYLGWYFAAAGFVFLVAFVDRRWRAIACFTAVLAMAVLPTTIPILASTGNPLFPFVAGVFGDSPWHVPAVAQDQPLWRLLRLVWDVTFARERVNQQPPFSPLFAGFFAVTLAVAWKERRAAFLAILSLLYFAIYVSILPGDSRYLLPLLPLVAVCGAVVVARWRVATVALTILSIVGGLAYVGYRVKRQGPPPLDAVARRAYLERRIPEYRALQKRGEGFVYACGAEKLMYFGEGRLLGEVVGPYANADWFGRSRNTAELAARLQTLQVSEVLLSRSVCPREWQALVAEPEFELVYADAGALLWRLRAAGISRR